MRFAVLFLSVCIALLTGVGLAQAGESVEELWTQWQSDDDAAYEKLVELGPESRDLAPRLVEALCVTDTETDWNAFHLLLAIQADAVPAIVAALQNSLDDRQRKTLIGLLETIGPMSREAGDPLLLIAVGESGALRDAALRALAAAQIKKDFLIPELIQALSRSNLYDRSIGIPSAGPDRLAKSAAALLGKCPDDRAFLPLIRTVRFHPKAGVRELALQSLATSYGPDEMIISVLIDALDDHAATLSGFGGSGSVAESSLNWLKKYEALDGSAAPRLISRLYRASYAPPGVWPPLLAEIICRCPTTDVQAAALVKHKLKPLLKDDAFIISHRFPGGEELERKRMQVAIASIVLKWEPENRAPAEQLARVADEKGAGDFRGFMGMRIPDVRAEAARGLGRLGAASRVWLPLLHRILQREAGQPDPHEPISELAFDAAWAIARIDSGDEQCLTVLKRAGGELQARRISWHTIETVLGARAARLTDINAVVKKLKDLDDPWPGLSAWDCEKLRPHFAVVAPVLFQQLKSERVADRKRALISLSHLRVQPDIVVPRIVESLRDPRATIRAAAAKALKPFAPLSDKAVSALEQATRDEYLTVRFSAEDALMETRRKAEK